MAHINTSCVQAGAIWIIPELKYGKYHLSSKTSKNTDIFSIKNHPKETKIMHIYLWTKRGELSAEDVLKKLTGWNFKVWDVQAPCGIK